jgi:hypothetical protein
LISPSSQTSGLSPEVTHATVCQIRHVVNGERARAGTMRGWQGKRRLEGPPPKGGRGGKVGLDFQTFFFCFVHPVHALLNSTPQLLARDRRAVAQGAELGPGDLRMDAAA